MNYADIILLLAQQNGGGGGNGKGGFMEQWLPCLVITAGIAAIWYFIVIRPKQKKREKRDEMLDALDKNDKVITMGGLQGKITKVGEDLITIKIDENNNTKVKCKRWAIRDNLTKKDQGNDEDSE